MQKTDNKIVRVLSSSWIDLVLFKVNWAMLVFYQSAAVVPAMLVIFLKLFSWQELGHSLALVFTTALVGIGMDFVMAGTGVFIFSEPFPLWLIMLWISFALTFWFYHKATSWPASTDRFYCRRCRVFCRLPSRCGPVWYPKRDCHPANFHSMVTVRSGIALA